MEHSMSIVACRFQRTKKSQWEKGIAVGRDGNVDTILDQCANPINTVLNYILKHVRISVDIEI